MLGLFTEVRLWLGHTVRCENSQSGMVEYYVIPKINKSYFLLSLLHIALLKGCIVGLVLSLDLYFCILGRPTVLAEGYRCYRGLG